ncbi:MAG TPA: PAS domain S-box protein [Bryobacteraceae bacterium]|nr:PAS domain S-box protein [Bryobacteraceae bacterium]
MERYRLKPLSIGERHAALMETLSDCAIYTLDVDGAISSWSAGAEAVEGYAEEEILGRNGCILYAQKGAEPGEYARALQLAASSGRYQYEGWQTRKDGSPFWGQTVIVSLRDAEGNRRGFSVVTRDVTESRRTEERLRLAVESAPTAMVMTNQEGRIVLVNSQTERMFGYRRNELIGARVDVLAPAGSRARHAELRAHYSKNPKTRAMEARDLVAVRKDGSSFPALIGLNPIETGEGTWVMSSIVDITERKRVEDVRKKLDSEIQYSQKLESLGILAGGIAHDFNNILAGILGQAGLALMELPADSPARNSLKLIEVASLQAAELTKQMLAYSGKGQFLIRPLNLSRLLGDMSHLLGVSLSKKAALRMDLPDELPSIEGDRVQMQQIAMNLITNASEALGDNAGSITVRTGMEFLGGEPLAGSYFNEKPVAGRHVFLEVSDTGHGMDEETMRRAFDPFFTTKFTGRGLGLAAVLGIVRGHNGVIQLQSEPGRGTTFKVYFPVSLKEAPARVKRAEPAGPRTGQGKVLVIDDEAGVRAVAAHTLRKCGFSVILAKDGEEGLALFRQQPEEIGLVLLDLTMPKMSGDEVLQELRRIRPAVKVIVSSGYDEQDDSDRFAGEGFAGFLLKPYQPLQLIDKACRVLNAGNRGQ